MTPNELKRRFPNASQSMVEANCSVSHAESKRDEAPTLGRTVPGKKESIPSITVRFVGYRVRPLDPDNFAGSVKDLLDGLRHAQLIPGDESWQIKLETEQVKVSKFSEEKTEILILKGIE